MVVNNNIVFPWSGHKFTDGKLFDYCFKTAWFHLSEPRRVVLSGWGWETIAQKSGVACYLFSRHVKNMDIEMVFRIPTHILKDVERFCADVLKPRIQNPFIRYSLGSARI
jgi:hypothetical protein